MNKYRVIQTGRFKKDVRKLEKQGCDIGALIDVVKTIAAGNSLPPALKDHSLSGNYKGFRECHVEPDWLLIYKIAKEKLVLVLSRTGSHSELF